MTALPFSIIVDDVFVMTLLLGLHTGSTLGAFDQHRPGTLPRRCSGEYSTKVNTAPRTTRMTRAWRRDGGSIHVHHVGRSWDREPKPQLPQQCRGVEAAATVKLVVDVSSINQGEPTEGPWTFKDAARDNGHRVASPPILPDVGGG